jgi:hypothetical protein
MKQVYAWRYYLSNYHENWDKLHWIHKLWDKVGRCVWRFYPSNDQGGTQTNSNESVVGWSTYMCLKILTQQWSEGTVINCTRSVNCGMKQLHVLEGNISAMIRGAPTNCDDSVHCGMTQLHIFEGSKSATTRMDWDQLQWIKELRDLAVNVCLKIPSQ